MKCHHRQMLPGDGIFLILIRAKHIQINIMLNLYQYYNLKSTPKILLICQTM
jgi:hypothetical protein